MNKQILVQVTQADIDKGCPRDILNCPIANALRRAIADCLLGSVSGYYYFWKLRNGPAYRAEIPESGVRFIIQFDLCSEGQPFSFAIEPKIFRKQAYKGILIDSNGTVTKVTHYQEEAFTLWCLPPKNCSFGGKPRNRVINSAAMLKSTRNPPAAGW